MTMTGGMQGYTTGGGNDKLHERIAELEAEVERLKATERFLRSERPMARKLTELEKRNAILMESLTGVEQLEKQRDELLSACEKASELIDKHLKWDRRIDDDMDFIDAVITSVKGSK